MLKVYCWLTICGTKWRLQGSTMLTYFGNCASQLKRSAEESWPMYPYFCTTIHLLTGRMLDKLKYSNADMKKCVIHHMRPDHCIKWLPSVSTFEHTPPWTHIFDRRWAQVCNRTVVEGAVGTVLFYRHWQTPTSLHTVHWHRRWLCWHTHVCTFVYLLFK